jgi:hypothetical protein
MPVASRILQSTLSYTELNICCCRGAVSVIGADHIFPSPLVPQQKKTVRTMSLGNNKKPPACRRFFIVCYERLLFDNSKALDVATAFCLELDIVNTSSKISS